ncbi:hypothetical protein RMCBS344292_11591 [Rhizopus microsporus]|nr:hypothetical protein RMCBS344292_11591 [Rhizopus microsporus]
MIAFGLKQQGIEPIILTPTGVAAFPIGGQTIHKFFGISVSDQVFNPIRLADFLKIHKDIAFLIDEISMVSGQLINKMSEAVAAALKKPLHFGGMLTILFGGLGQLQPIRAVEGGHFFDSYVIRGSIRITLTLQQRQIATDTHFQAFLRKIRIGITDDTVVQYIMQHRRDDRDIPLAVMRLFTSRTEVQDYIHVL